MTSILNKGKRSFSLAGSVVKAGSQAEVPEDVAKKLVSMYPDDILIVDTPKKQKTSKKKEKDTQE